MDYNIKHNPGERTCIVTFFFNGETADLPTPYYPEIESDVRANFYAWRAHAFAYAQQRRKINGIIDALTCAAERTVYNAEMR